MEKNEQVSVWPVALKCKAILHVCSSGAGQGGGAASPVIYGDLSVRLSHGLTGEETVSKASEDSTKLI